MKKLLLLSMMLLAFSVGTMAQSTAPKLMSPRIDYWEEAWTESDMQDLSFIIWTFDEDWNYLDPEGWTYSIYTDDDQIFTFTPEEFPELDEPMTEIPVGYDGIEIDPQEIHFYHRSAVNAVENPFFTWRIGIKVNYIVEGIHYSTDIIYLEVFPKMHPATADNVSPTAFIADWTSPENNTQQAGFMGYDLYVIDKNNPQDTIKVADIPSLKNDDGMDIPGGMYLVEDLTPGATYEYYVVAKHNWVTTVSIPSNVQEVTLPSVTSAPVMLPVDEDYLTPTEFMAEWTDATPAEYVTDYTLYVGVAAQTPEVLLTETFGGVNVESDQSANIANYLNQYCDNLGWKGAYLYQAAGGGLKAGNSSNGGVLTSPELDLSNSNGVITVRFNAMTYETDNTVLTVSCGDASQTVTLTREPVDYTVVLSGVPADAGQKVTISSTGSKKRWYIYNVEVLTGDATVVTDPMVFTGITDKGYIVENLTPGTTYNYYVVANYTDGTSATSNVEQVTMPLPPMPELIADPQELTIIASYGGTETATFDVLGANLTGDVTITLSDENEMFAVNPTTISIADAEEGATVTVSYTPTEPGEHTATITLSTPGTEDVIVNVSGMVTLDASAPVMLPADEEYVTSTSFRADWTDETPAANVVDYTLYVNMKAETPDAGALLINETFGSEEVPSSDGNMDIGESGSLDDFCDNLGWTGYGVYLAGGGGVKLSSGSKTGYLTSPALDLTNCGGKVTVNFIAMSYGSDNSSIIVKCGEVSDTIQLTAESDDYSVVLEGVTAQPGQNVTLSGTRNGKRLYIYSVKIYNGEESPKAVVEQGNAISRVIKGITDKYYVVENLTPGATYTYYVEANYIDGTMAASNVEEVTLLTQTHDYAPGDVNHSGNVNIEDVTVLIDYMLETGDACEICADVNGDGIINISDVTALIDLLLDTPSN